MVHYSPYVLDHNIMLSMYIMLLTWSLIKRGSRLELLVNRYVQYNLYYTISQHHRWHLIFASCGLKNLSKTHCSNIFGPRELNID